MKLSAVFGLIIFVAVSLTSAQTTVLMGPKVYDGKGGPPLVNAVIQIAEQRIACVGTIESCPPPDGAEVIDLSGQFVAPGLVDTHVHFGQTGWLDARPDAGIGLGLYNQEEVQKALKENPDRWHRAYLCSGITAVYDAGGLPWSLGLEAAAEQHPKRVHVRAAGPLITNAYPTGNGSPFLPMTTDEEALAGVYKLANLGARSIKVLLRRPFSEEAAVYEQRLSLIGEHARSRGLQLIVHAQDLDGAKAALRARAHLLVHSVEGEPVDSEFIQLALEAGTFYAPTLLVGQNWARAVASVSVGAPYPIDDPNGCVDPEMRQAIQDAVLLQATLPEERRRLDRIFDSLAMEGSDVAIKQDNLRRVHDAGILVAMATDAGNPLTLHGPSVYAEMEAMEAGGIPASDVLVMSTRNGAAAMGRLDDFGTLEVGKLADLIVLLEDPGASTSAFRSITHVMRGGILHEIKKFASP